MKSTTFETGMSDFHKLTTTILRNTINKGNAKKIFYRDYKAFDHNTFETRLQPKLTLETIIDCSQFQSLFLETLNNIAPVKMKILRYNNNPLMNKALRKAIMTSSSLKNKFNKNNSAKNWNSYKKQRNFCLKLVRQTKKKYFNNINVKKVSDSDIPAKLLKKSVDIYMKEIIFVVNDCNDNGIFPDDLNLADVSPIFKKENYRPVSILPHMPKVFERILYKQIVTFMTTKFSSYLYGFRTNHNVQYSLLKMIETWKKHLDKGEKIGVILMDLSKAFDTINQIIACYWQN